jgi:hypothetical protein
MHWKITGRNIKMGKHTDLGLAKRDDPIYSGGLAMSFNRPSTKSTGVTAPSTAGAQPQEATPNAAPERVDPAVGAVQVMQQRFGKPSTLDSGPA